MNLRSLNTEKTNKNASTFVRLIKEIKLLCSTYLLLRDDSLVSKKYTLLTEWVYSLSLFIHIFLTIDKAW